MRGKVRYILCVTLLGVSACAGTSREVQREVMRLENSLADLRNFQAEQTTQISNLSASLREIEGRVEKLEYSQRHQFGSDLTTLKRDLSDLRRRVPPPPIVPGQALDEDEALLAELPKDVAVPFDQALAALRQGRFNEAVPLLRTAIDNSGSNEWVAYLYFWLGVAYDGLGDNTKALGAYHTVVSQYPKQVRTPLALLREASVFIRLKDTKTAALTLKKLITEFPASSEARIAKERLKDLK